MSHTVLQRIDTVFLPVSNLENAIAWYTTRLGLALRWRVEGYAALELGETPLTLVEVKDYVATFTHAPFNFFTADIEVAHQTLRDAGVEVGDIANPGDVRFFRFKDPDGNPLEVCCW